MKNIHILPTVRPSRLQSNRYSKLFLSEVPKAYADCINQNIYITSDKEIKEGVNEWYLDKFINKPRNSSGSQYSEKQDVIILTSDQDLIEYGVQAIDDDFLEWFVKNQSCEEVEVRSFIDAFEWRTIYKIITPKEEPEQERSYSEEEFLEFSEWVSDNDWVYLPSKSYWVNEEQEELEQKFTTKQLFEKFKNK